MKVNVEKRFPRRSARVLHYNEIYPSDPLVAQREKSMTGDFVSWAGKKRIFDRINFKRPRLSVNVQDA
jgi:hypothetical protein